MYVYINIQICCYNAEGGIHVTFHLNIETKINICIHPVKMSDKTLSIPGMNKNVLNPCGGTPLP